MDQTGRCPCSISIIQASSRLSSLLSIWDRNCGIMSIYWVLTVFLALCWGLNYCASSSVNDLHIISTFTIRKQSQSIAKSHSRFQGCHVKVVISNSMNDGSERQKIRRETFRVFLGRHIGCNHWVTSHWSPGKLKEPGWVLEEAWS